ncbi:MAG TPA: hypothetical protein PKD61_09700 [Polyangiaceae bacterium]|nr:hypothetical protein [Polyangiaceae bacterium]
MGYAPTFIYSCGAPWLIVPLVAADEYSRHEDAIGKQADELGLAQTVGTLPVGDHSVLVVPSESIAPSVEKYEGPLGRGSLPGLMLVLSGDADSLELLYDNAGAWTPVGVFEVPSGPLCLVDSAVRPDFGAPAPPGHTLEVPAGAYEVFEFQSSNAHALWLQRPS